MLPTSRAPRARRPRGSQSDRAQQRRRLFLESLEERRVLAAGFFQGFEIDDAGWDVFGSPYDASRVSSGTNGITSRTGGHHGQLTAGNIAATPFGPSILEGRTNTFPDGGYTTSIDIYLDLSGGWANDTRFDWDSSINQPNGSHRRDFIFNAGFYSSSDMAGPGAGLDRFVVSASNNSSPGSAYPKNPGKDPIAITSSGWHTFQHTFYDAGSGVLAVDMTILDPAGNPLKTWTLSDPSDIIGSTVGGNRSGWFSDQDFSVLAFDNNWQSGPNAVYVDDDWAALPAGTDPDGPGGPANLLGFDAFGTIQQGLDAVASGGTVNAAAGTYAENLLITSPVTLQGANQGLAGNDVGRGPESTITPSSAFGIEVRADQVTIDGFEITDYNRDGINVRPTNSSPGVATRGNVTIQNNYIHEDLVPGAQVNGIVFGESHTGESTDVATISNVTIANNWIDVTDDSSARGIILTGHFASIQFNDFTISDNVIQARNNGLFASENPAQYTIDGIEVTGNRFERPGSLAINMGNLDATSKINNNTFINNTSGAALNFRQAGGEVQNNTFENHTNVGLFFFDATFFPQSSENATVTGNVFTSNPYRHVGAPAVAVDLTAIENNNTFDGRARVSGLRNIYGTIQSAVDAATAGDTVTVHDGTYVENVLINKNVALISENGRAATTIQGVSGVGSLGAVLVTGGTTAVELGRPGQGFTIVGIDNGAAGIENAAVYFQGGHSGASIVDNQIQANGDGGLITEYGAAITGFLVDGNIFSGQTFVGAQPAGIGFGSQFDTPNVPRQLVVFGNGGNLMSPASATNITFTNNQIVGTAGGISSDDNVSEQGNTLVTLDVANSTISGNTFAGTTTRFGAALRVRRPDTTISGNTFVSTGMGLGTEHMFLQNNTTPVEVIVPANILDRGAYVPGGSDVSVSIAGGVGRATAGDTVHILSGTYGENLDLTASGVNKNLTLHVHNPGSTGQITLNGNLTLDSNDELILEFEGASLPNYDQWIVNGTVELDADNGGGATLTLGGSYMAATGNSFLLIDNNLADPVSGTFDGLPEGTPIPLNGANLFIGYEGNTGNDVVLGLSRIMDNDNTGYSDTGGLDLWTNQGYLGDVREFPVDAMNQTATYTFGGLTPGSVFQVSATWTEFVNRAIAAPYAISGVTLPETVHVDQRLAPNDFSADGATWEILGSYLVDGGGTLTVTLSEQTPGRVIADAVRIEQLTVPEIRVQQDTSEILHLVSDFDFGSAPLSAMVTREFTVTNVGGDNLLLYPVVVSGPFFVVGPNFTVGQTLTPGQSATIELGMDATTAGAKTGSVTIPNNDADEALFTFDLSGTVEAPGVGMLIIDNDNSGYSDSGNWGYWTGQGFQNDVREAGTGGVTEVATYTFNGLTPGSVYDVSATWTPFGNRAPDAGYAISGVTAGQTVSVNQTQSPNDFNADGAAWENLGTYTVGGSGTITVTLSGSNLGRVIADAVRIDHRGDAEIVVTHSGGGVESGVSSVDIGSGFVNTTVEKIFTVTNIGATDLVLQPISLTPATGFTVVSNFSAGQIVSPGNSANFTIGLVTSTVGAKNASLSFATNDADESPFTFSLTGTVTPAVTIIDDGAAVGYTDTANMTVWAQGFQGDVREAVVGGVAQGATYTFSGLPAGTYRVSATWTAYYNRASNAQYVINAGSPIAINQKLAPNNPLSTPEGSVVLDSSGTWFADLDSTYSLPGGGSITVNVSDTGANGNVIIDAIRVERIGALHLEGGSDSFVPATGSPVATIRQADVDGVLRQAIDHWTQLDATAATRLDGVQVIVKDLPPAILGFGSFTTPTIWLDSDAAGRGWNLAGFSPAPRNLEGVSQSSGVDLLTVVAHELGHVLGYLDLDPAAHPGHLMAAELPVGQQRLPGGIAASRSAGSLPSGSSWDQAPIALASRFQDLTDSLELEWQSALARRDGSRPSGASPSAEALDSSPHAAALRARFVEPFAPETDAERKSGQAAIDDFFARLDDTFRVEDELQDI